MEGGGMCPKADSMVAEKRGEVEKTVVQRCIEAIRQLILTGELLPGA
jgi:hypothetical protein